MLKVGKLGIGQGTAEIKIPFYKAPFEAIYTCFDVSWRTLQSLGAVITGKSSSDGLSGPIGIAGIIGQAASQSIVELIWLSAFLSISLGLINLFPIPMLDGGHLLFYFIEAIRGKPVSEKTQERAYQVGFFIVLSLMLFATWNDLKRLKVFDLVAGLFSF
jgi:regulator of sigma E protease